MKKRKGRRKLRIGRLLLCLVIVIVLTSGITFGVKYILKVFDRKDTPEVSSIKKDKDKTYELTLAMVGDNLIHGSLYEEASKYANYNGYDFRPMYEYLKEIIEPYDLAYYNQETILGGSEIGLSSYPAFNSPYEVGDAMIDAGFNLVSLATNHTLDRGEEAIINSCNYWNSKKNIMTAGSYCSEEDRNEVQVMEKNNITYSLLSYTYGTNGIDVPDGKEYLVNVWPAEGEDPASDSKYQAYKEQVKEDIERVRDKVDVLMVAMHWGIEYTHTPTNYQIDMANFLADNGVDIVIGSHPHVVMPVTWIDDTLVIYSLGNLISGQEEDLDYAKLVGLLTSIKITKNVKDGISTITLSDLNNELLYTSYNNKSNYKVIPFSNSIIKEYNSDYERLYNKYSAVIKDMDNTVPVASLN